MDNQEKQVRPTSLTILGVLSLIGNSVLILSFIVILLAAGIVDLSIEFDELNEFLQQGYDKIIPQLIAVSLSFAGVILMLKLKKVGFYIYAGGQVIWTIYQHGTFDLISTGIFVALYAIHFKYLID